MVAVAFIMLATSAFAQGEVPDSLNNKETADSVSVNLQEVVVEGVRSGSLNSE